MKKIIFIFWGLVSILFSAESVYEAEIGKIIDGDIASQKKGHRRSGYVKLWQDLGPFVDIPVRVDQEGIYRVTLRWLNDGNHVLSAEVYANYEGMGTYELAPGESDRWQETEVTVYFKGGINSVKVLSASVHGAPLIDGISLARDEQLSKKFCQVYNREAAAPQAGTSFEGKILEAEHCKKHMGKEELEHRGFTGSGFINLDNRKGSFIEFEWEAKKAEEVTLVLRYANGTRAARPMEGVLNGKQLSSSPAFEPSGNWKKWKEEAQTVKLKRGKNVLRLSSSLDSGGPNLDHLRVVVGEYRPPEEKSSETVKQKPRFPLTWKEDLASKPWKW